MCLCTFRLLLSTTTTVFVSTTTSIKWCSSIWLSHPRTSSAGQLDLQSISLGSWWSTTAFWLILHVFWLTVSIFIDAWPISQHSSSWVFRWVCSSLIVLCCSWIRFIWVCRANRIHFVVSWVNGSFSWGCRWGWLFNCWVIILFSTGIRLCYFGLMNGLILS